MANRGIMGDPGSIAKLIHRLRPHFLANLEQHAQFALLSDFLHALSLHLLSDADLLDCAVVQRTFVSRFTH